jgi:hypothetical protein
MMFRTSLAVLVGFLVVFAGCSSDPQYITPGPGTSFSLEFDSANMTPLAPQRVVMPFEVETAEDAADRAMLAAELAVEVPYVKLEDVDISIEWSVKNLLDCDAQATFNINGGNEYFFYDPTVFVIDPDEDEEPPPLIGNMAPVSVPASATVTGVFREDQIREAAIDLELITRAHYNPFRALLEVNKNLETMEIYTEVDLSVEDPPPQMGTGVFIPREAWAQLVQFDMLFAGLNNDPDPGCGGVHLVFEWDYRIRDQRGIVHDEGLDADPAELTPFAPVGYSPPGALP